MDDYDALVEFVLLGCYPSGLCKYQKRLYRRKAQENYKVDTGGVLFYSAIVQDGDWVWRRVVNTKEECCRMMKSCHVSLKVNYMHLYNGITKEKLAHVSSSTSSGSICKDVLACTCFFKFNCSEVGWGRGSQRPEGGMELSCC